MTDEAKKAFNATMNDMRELINKTLDEHPPLSQFISRV